MTRIIIRLLALLVWSRRYEGMSLRPFGADGVEDGAVRCDGGMEGTERVN